ncbi:hypothetical protein PC114_g9933 [Phytophthora cactorum]|nr:hypothetical protein PC114_g9933 [Phytophthora cactorum]KAG3023161.1 hypothetical protein PC120_g7729 [Phytophthora cactorum]KAG3190403.1 hypothetical protein PC128_g11332 [Phytophthora cactorum]
MIVGVGKETKGYRVYLPKDKVMVTTQHIRNIGTLSKEQNLNVQRLYWMTKRPKTGRSTRSYRLRAGRALLVRGARRVVRVRRLRTKTAL